MPLWIENKRMIGFVGFHPLDRNGFMMPAQYKVCFKVSFELLNSLGHF